MSECKTCNGEQILNYYGECCICCDCSDEIKIFDYIQKLKAENEKLKKCVKFYAHIGNWADIGGSKYTKIIPIDISTPLENTPTKIGGKLARQTLRELEGFSNTIVEKEEK